MIPVTLRGLFSPPSIETRMCEDLYKAQVMLLESKSQCEYWFALRTAMEARVGRLARDLSEHFPKE